MTSENEELAAFRKRLDDLSKRIDARKWEFQHTGEFSDIHTTLIRQILQKHDKLKMRVDAVEHGGTRWDLVRAEMIRDNSSLFDDLLQLEELFDAEVIKKRDAPDK